MFIKIFFFILAVLPNLIAAPDVDTRIVGGVVSSSYIPYQIALYINGKFACGGSLLTKYCVITAAHCVKGRAASAFKVRAGILKLSSTGGTSRAVSQTFVAPNYSEKTLNYDVAILRLATVITGSNIAPIALNNAAIKVGDQMKVSGWGITSETSSTVSDQLRYVFVPAIAKGTCSIQYSGLITNTMFCAGVKTGGKDSCSGDSGGPVVKDNKLYGIVSWGYGCARKNYPGVYTDVKQVLPWINSIKTKNC